VGALLIAGVVAAAVSTVNTLCITVGEAVGRDIYQRFINRNASDQLVVRVTQGGIIVAVIVALIGGLWRPDFVIFILQWAAAIFLATYIPAFVMSLYWKGSTGTGIQWGMVVGGILYPTLTIIERQVGGEAGFVRAYGLHSVIYATAVAFIVMYVVSKVTKNSPEEERRSTAYRKICFPTGRLLAIAGKPGSGDWLWINVIMVVTVVFIAWYIFSIIS
jgi:sodium/pantothenate symporter